MNKTEKDIDLEDLELIQECQIDDNIDSDEMFEHFSLEVDKGQTLFRIDKFLSNRMEKTSRHRIQIAADAGNILVNGISVKSSYKVKPLDRISIVLPYPPNETTIMPEEMPLNIVYEDDDLMIINKEAGVVVHPGHGNFSGTLVHGLTYHLKDLPLFQTGDVRAGLVHRIDKNTSGLLVIAKNEKSHINLAKQFFDHTIERCYVAMVWGNPVEEEGTITKNIGRSLKNRLKMDTFDIDSGIGKHAVTHYKVIERLGYVNLIECRLETGRTHQIRVHMKHIGHPLFNDERYGGDIILRGTTFTKYKQFVKNCFEVLPRHALHARSIGFIHPTTKEKIYFESEIPQDFQNCINKWRGYISSREIEQSEES